MKILYEGYIYSAQSAGGINRYFERVISLLPAQYQPTILALHVRPDNWPTHPNLQVVRAPFFSPERLARRLARHYFQLRAAQLQPDLVHPTYFQSLSLKPINSYGCPSVFTVYDFIMDIFADQIDPSRAEVEKQKAAILAADALLCISHNTKRDLLERFPHLEPRVTVTPLAGDLDISLSYGAEPVPARPYFLFVGSRTRYKNFDGLLRAFAPLAQNGADLALAVMGDAFSADENQLIEELELTKHVENWGRLRDAHLAKMYRCALALVYPSFYEGFGIPPLEAMNCQTLVIAANNSSIPEVTGDAALLFDAAKTDELFDRLRAVWHGEVDRAALIEKGRARAAQFSWERTAEQTAAVYRALAG